VTREDGVKSKVYGGRFHEGTFLDANNDPVNWVARLQRTLVRRGFRLHVSWATHDTKTVQATFTPETEWAVREFQIAAGYEMALPEGGQPIPMPAETAYSGPISGVLNAETLKALKFWDSQPSPLICPIEISGFGGAKPEAGETTGSAPEPTVQQPNLWRDNEITSTSRVFTRDQSGQFYRPGLPEPPRDPENYQVTGGTVEWPANSGKFGPVTNENHAWKRESDESEVLPERLFDLASGSAFDQQLATFRIIRAAAGRLG
jgi:hypothetical protein